MTGADLSKLVRWFSGLRVTVIGDAMLDTYSRGTVNRICREAPVPIVTVEEREDVPGGAANTAANVAALGRKRGWWGSSAMIWKACCCGRSWKAGAWTLNAW